MREPLARFLVVGVANTIFGYGVILALQIGLKWSPWSANAAGYVAGFVLSYALNRRFTFQSRRSHRSGIPAFLMAACVSYGINVCVLRAALAVPGFGSAVAQAAAVAAYSVTFYLLSRYFVFRRGDT